jgi:hypothetical protein
MLSDHRHRPGGPAVRTGHHVRQWRGVRAARLGAALVAATSGALLALTSAGAASSPVLTKSGPVSEGPYPYRYPASGDITPGTGTTISGQACHAGAGQFDSPYADPCIAKFTGDNGGATSNGVTAKTITLVDRVFPTTANIQELEAEAKAAGAALPQVTTQVAETFLKYFNKVYDLYGRRVVIKTLNSTADSTAEALGQGQAGACADADTIANAMHAFGEAGLEGGGTAPFSTCAADDHLVEFNGDAYYDEGTFQSLNPYVWSTTQDCTRVSSSEAEVVGSLLAGKKAIYAGDPALRDETRKFGGYTPNVGAYERCSLNFANIVEHKYHVPAAAISTHFNYDLDIATFEQSAQQAVVQFKAAGVTTVIVASDPYSAGLLTEAAAQQNYYPEWFIVGTGGTDIDGAVQAYDNPAEVTGHLFGMSESSPVQDVYGDSSLAGRLYKKLTGHDIPMGTDGEYSSLVEIFDALQAAGPDLTPGNLARGLHALPVLGAPAFSYGTWDWNTGPTGTPGGGDHTAGTSARFVYWDATKISPVNKKLGTYVQIFGGRRFTLGQWPKSLPTLFTGD